MITASSLIATAPYTTISLPAAITELSGKAIRRKIEDGKWVDGREYRRSHDGGVFISIKGENHFPAAATALQAVYDRSKPATTWRNFARLYDEMDALHTFVDLHSFQVKQLGRAEFLRAIDSAVASGKAQGNTVSVVKDLAALE